MLTKSGLKYPADKMLKCLFMLTVLFTFLLAANPGTAGATNTVGDKTSTITVTVNDNGTVTTAGSFTVRDLQSMSQVRSTYSAINNNIDKKFYATEGVLLNDLLARAGIDLNNIDKFTFTATDNYDRTFTKSYLLDTERYCYPNLKDNSFQGAIQVQPVLALKSMEFTDHSQADYNLIDDYYAVRLFFGQNEQDLVSDHGYVKWLNQIQVFTKPLNARPPALTADTTNNSVGQAVHLSFTDEQKWRNAITGLTVDGISSAGKYSVVAGKITIDGSVFDREKDYAIVVKASGYQDAVVTQHKGPWPVIFTVEGDAVTQRAYTMADLRAMPATTGQYGALSCKGVYLQDLLTAANITTPSLQAQINVTDSATFHIDPVSVGNLLDPANRYLLTYDIDGQPIAIDSDDKTNLRIFWGIGGIGVIYKNVTGITIDRPTVNAKYTITPVADTAYQSGETADGSKTMTVKTGVSGMNYFAVQVASVTAHNGSESVVFEHLRNGVQLSSNITKADFDAMHTARAGFNVQPGDVVKAYIVDDLTNADGFNPILLQ